MIVVGPPGVGKSYGVEFELEHESLSCLKIDNIFDKVVELLQIEKAIKYRLEREKKKRRRSVTHKSI
jgi:hypothetical protein